MLQNEKNKTNPPPSIRGITKTSLATGLALGGIPPDIADASAEHALATLNSKGKAALKASDAAIREAARFVKKSLGDPKNSALNTGFRKPRTKGK